MNNVERGLKIIDIFTNLQEHVSKIGGYLDQGESFIDKNPECGMAACIGGWLADYFKTEVYRNPDNDGYHRRYSGGVRELSNRLDEGVIEVFVFNSGLWHNDCGGAIFGAGYAAYRRSETYPRSVVNIAIDIDDVCADWVQFGYNLVAEGE